MQVTAIVGASKGTPAPGPHRDDVPCTDVESSGIVEVPKILECPDLQDPRGL